MGKKHKKKSRQEKNEIEDAPSPAPSSIASTTVSEPPLKLVLKVGGNKSQVGTSESYNIQENTASDASTPQRDQHVKKKKKKKKKSSDREKEKSATKREYESYESHETNSQEDGELSRDETTMDEDIVDETTDRTEEDMDTTTDLNPPKAKKALLISQDESESAKDKLVTPANRPVRDNKDLVPEKKPLQRVLENLQRTLQKKDVDCFFAWPVNDVIAPGYSSIISTPMDFSTMKKKVETNQYQSIEEYKNDFNLMCNNATTYNGPDTIYNKAAKKLLMAGAKIMKRERLLTLKRAYGYYEEGDAKIKSRRKKVIEGDTATEDSSGIDGEAMEVDTESIRDQADRGRDSEEETAEEILDQVLQSAKGAKDRLTARRPGSKIGFLRREKSGTTTLNILNPDKAGQRDSREVKLGLLTARLTHGTGSVPGFKEDKRNKVTPVSYMNYGAYSSFAPTYDSTYSNISKEESDLLYSTYGDKSAYQYTQSIQDYVKDCGDYAVNLVDNLLDMMTNGDHSKAKKALDKKRKENEQKEKESDGKDKSGKEQDKTKQVSDGGDKKDEFDFDSLKSLSDLGIDMSFLPTIEKEIKKEKNEPTIKKEPSEMEKKLTDTSALIGNLEKTQNDRMSQKPPPHLSFTPGPSDQECAIAEKITQQLLALTSKVTPGDVAPAEGVRKAMGIELQPSTSPALPQEGPAIDDPLDQMPASGGMSGGVDKELLDLLEGSGSKS